MSEHFKYIANRNKGAAFKDWLTNSQPPLTIYSPFITSSGAEQLLKTPFNGSTLIIRGLEQDFSSGVVCIELLTKLILNQWDVRFNHKLHAKIFKDTKSSGFLGSVNLTLNGLMPYPIGNLETFIFFEALPREVCIEAITCLNDSKKITLKYLDEINEWLKKYVKDSDQEVPFPKYEEDKIYKEIFTLLDVPQSLSLEKLYQDIQEGNFSDHRVLADVALLKIGEDFSLIEVKKSFIATPLVQKILEIVGERERFGVIRRWMEQNIVDVPTPSRDDFNTQLNKLYDLIVEAHDGKYIKERPRHTEFLVKSY